MVTLDFGALYNGYCSDITRTIAVGSCSDEFHKIYHIVLEALINSGEKAKSIDDLTREYITKKSLWKSFRTFKRSWVRYGGSRTIPTF